MTLVQKIAGLLVVIAIACFSTWKVQDRRYGEKIAEQAGLHKDDLAAISNAAAAQAQAEQDKRFSLERRLKTIDEAHFEEFSDAQENILRLRDRLATSDLRLSILLAEDSASGCAVPSTPGAVGVVPAARRAQLDPAHAQRIIGITDAGDQGLIALRACQAYVSAIVR